MIKKGGPSSGSLSPEWSISDDGLGMLTGTLKVFLDGNPAMDAKSGSSMPTSLTSGNAPSLFTQYSGANGLSNPKPAASGGGLGPDIPKTGDTHPFDGRLKCFGVTVNRNSMGYGYAEAQYVGLLNDPAGVEFEITANTEDSPIELHPQFLAKYFKATEAGKEVSDEKYAYFGTVLRSGINPQTKGPYWNLKNVHIDGPTQSFKGFRASEEIIEKRLVGVESYKTPLAVVRISYTTAQIGYYQWALRSLGCIFDSIPEFINKNLGVDSSSYSDKATTVADSTKGVGQAAQTVSGDKQKQNFLLTNASISQASGLYKVSVEFMRSGPYGWNPIIYMPYDSKALDKALSSPVAINK